jgi:alpha-beta hydrolase superfamily lysophospholipase
MLSIFDHPAFSASLFFPQRNKVPPPDGARDLFVEVAPGVRLQVRAHTRPGTFATLLLFHGNGEYAASYDSFAGDFGAAGADLIVADFRGYGQSTGEPSLRACLDDARPVLAAAREAAGHPSLFVMGRSLGSACAAELYKDTTHGVAGYVFESAPADLYGTLRRRGVSIDKLPEDDLATFCPLRKLRQGTAPALVLHGEEDTLIPPSEVGLTFGALGTRVKERVMIPGRGHNNVSDHPLYWEALARFIARLAVRPKG